MNLFKCILILIAFIMYANANVNVGVLYKDIFISKKDAVVASKIWNKQMKEKRNLKAKIILYDDLNDLIDNYKKKKLQAILISPNIYYKNKKRVDLYSKYKWCLSKTDDKFSKYYILKNSQSKVSLKNLKNVEVLYFDETSKVWLELLRSEKYKVDRKIDFRKVKKDKKLMMDIFFNENRISIVREDVYDSMLELNPQIKNRTIILEESEKIFPISIGFDRKEMDKKDEEILNKIHNDINDEDVKIESISYMEINKIFHLSTEELKDLEKLYNRYFKLKLIKTK